MEKKEKKLTGERVYQGPIFDVESHRVQLPNGNPAQRDFVRFPGAVAIVPVTPQGEIVLVTQFRYPVGEELLELPAGKNETGENPLDCAHRELEEETGLVSDRWCHALTFFTTPGFTTEKMDLFFALDVRRVENPRPGDEDENISARAFSLTRCLEMIQGGDIRDGKTIVGLLAYDREVHAALRPGKFF